MAGDLELGRAGVSPNLDLRDCDWSVSRNLRRTGAFLERALPGDCPNDWLLLYVHGRDFSFHARAAAGPNGRLAGRSEAFAARPGAVGRGCCGHAAIWKSWNAGRSDGADPARDRIHISMRHRITVARRQSTRARTLHGHATDLRRHHARDCAGALRPRV